MFLLTLLLLLLLLFLFLLFIILFMISLTIHCGNLKFGINSETEDPSVEGHP